MNPVETKRAGRLIPARAGNTVCARFEVCRRAAHPRSRGEHVLVSDILTPYFGSSPLARGTHGSINRLEALGRLIPARAGNTLSRVMPLPA